MRRGPGIHEPSRAAGWAAARALYRSLGLGPVAACRFCALAGAAYVRLDPAARSTGDRLQQFTADAAGSNG